MIYNYKVKDAQGNIISLEQYKGKVLLFVNIATECGLTSQLEGLQKVYTKLQNQGVEILAFPSNQFFEQSPGTDEELQGFCSNNYNTTFKIFSKIDVNGESADPLYKYLREQAPQAAEDEASEALYKKLNELGFTTTNNDIKWNFTKFLVSKTGEVVCRFSSTTEPELIEDKIKELL